MEVLSKKNINIRCFYALKKIEMKKRFISSLSMMISGLNKFRRGHLRIKKIIFLENIYIRRPI
jgi:hypothetical protein